MPGTSLGMKLILNNNCTFSWNGPGNTVKSFLLNHSIRIISLFLHSLTFIQEPMIDHSISSAASGITDNMSLLFLHLEIHWFEKVIGRVHSPCHPL